MISILRISQRLSLTDSPLSITILVMRRRDMFGFLALTRSSTYLMRMMDLPNHLICTIFFVTTTIRVLQIEPTQPLLTMSDTGTRRGTGIYASSFVLLRLCFVYWGIWTAESVPSQLLTDSQQQTSWWWWWWQIPLRFMSCMYFLLNTHIVANIKYAG